MFIGKSDEFTRRAFMQRSGQLAVAGTAASYALGLAGLGEAAAFNTSDGYKALVCIFLYGGNDHNNTLVPFDAANYGLYSGIRGGNGEAGGGMALARADLAATALGLPQEQTLTNDIRYAMAPAMPRMKALYDKGAMAPLLNVGPLLAPLTRDEYNRNSAPRPPKLFSHNDQQSTWQSYSPEGATVGWGGRMGDIAMANNANVNSIFSCISASGNAVFLAGQNALSYKVSNSGAIAVNGVKSGKLYGSAAASDALEALLQQQSGHLLEADLTAVARRSIQSEAFVSAALGPVNIQTSFTQAGVNNGLAGQLNAVAKMIAARQQLGVRRQVFMVSMGGYDHHDNLMTRHQPLLSQVDFALDAFYRATVELGVADRVTAFTASDFGRTLSFNGNGSDHGWGSHHFVVGGAVRGGRFYGSAPAVSVQTPDQVGQGRLLPTTSVDEFTATLGKWFGVSDSEMAHVVPNIGRFAKRDIGFLRA